MGLQKQLCFGLVIFLSYIAFLAYAPNLLDINPNQKNVKIFKVFEGAFKPNERLSQSEKLFENKIVGPESLVLHKGVFYTGTDDGKVVSIDSDGNVKVLARLAPISRPAGMQLYKDDKLLVADTKSGLYVVDIKSGKSELLLSRSDSIGGKKLNIPNAVTVDSKGAIYVSDTSTRWSTNEMVFLILEHDKSGRIIKYEPNTKKATVLVDQLCMPNGVLISHDGQSLLIAETIQNRILRHHLEGPKKGTTEIFAELPGLPDNIRLSPRGGYWVALITAQNESSIGIVERSIQHPTVRKIIARLFHTTGSILEKINSLYPTPFLTDFSQNVKYGRAIFAGLASYCAVVELDVDGNIIQSLQSSDISFCLLSEAIEDNGYLYLASFANPYIIKTKL